MYFFFPFSLSHINSLLFCVYVLFFFFLLLLLYSQVSLSCPYTRTDKFKYFTRTNFGVTSLADNYYYYYHYLLFIIINIIINVIRRAHDPRLRRVKTIWCVCSLSLSFSLTSSRFSQNVTKRIVSHRFRSRIRESTRKYTPPSLLLISAYLTSL